MEVIAIGEAEARLAAIRGGQVDVLSEVPLASIADLEADPDIEIVSNPIGGSEVAYCQIDVPPFDNNHLRLAIKYATNRPQHNDLVYGGLAHNMNDIPLPGLIRFGLGGEREHNVAMAREHLSQAGYPDGIDLTLTLADMGDWMVWCPVWQQQLAEAGINMELNVTPADTYWGDQWLTAPFAMSGWHVRTVDHGLGLWYHSEAEWNETHWRSEAFDADPRRRPVHHRRGRTDQAVPQDAAADHRRGRPLRYHHVRLLQRGACRCDRLAAPRGVLHHRRPLDDGSPAAGRTRHEPHE